MHREDAVLVAGEVGELADVVPHPLIGRVEQVRAVLVHLDTGLRLGLGVRVAADVRAPVDDENTLVQLRCHALGDRQTEESGTDDKEIKTSGHRQQGYPTATALPDLTDRGSQCSARQMTRSKVAIGSQFRIATSNPTVTPVPSITSALMGSARSSRHEPLTDLPDVVHILRRLPCRTDVDAGSRQP